MTLRFRQVRTEDLDTLYAISLATGHAGGDASALHRQPRLIGEIYSAPYAVLSPEFVLVAEDAEGVAGYVLGAIDTPVWEARLEHEWWPRLRAVYEDPRGDPAGWTADQRRSWLIHHPVRTPPELTGPFPAHLHMNLLPRLQGQGVGARLLGEWLDRAVDAGATGLHIGVNRRNHRGAAFWAAQGFQDLPQLPEPFAHTRWMGMALGIDVLRHHKV